MNTMLDILGASIIGSMVFLTMLNLNIWSSQQSYASDSELRLQQNAKLFAEILDNDLRKIGFKYSGTSIITAEDKKISFYSDIDSTGGTDVVTLMLSDSSLVSYTSNPHDKILYRIVNSDTSKGPSLGITDLKFTYMDLNGNVTVTLSNIKYIRAEIWVDTPEKVVTRDKPQGEYISTYWEITINPRNI